VNDLCRDYPPNDIRLTATRRGSRPGCRSARARAETVDFTHRKRLLWFGLQAPYAAGCGSNENTHIRLTAKMDLVERLAVAQSLTARKTLPQNASHCKKYSSLPL